MGKVVHGPWTERDRKANREIARWNAKARATKKGLDTAPRAKVGSQP